ncbi:MAG: LysM domain-containing protein [Caldilineaceae bacterium]
MKKTNTAAADSAAQTSELPAEHVVAPGDTMISIALRYDMDWQDLLRINQLSENSVLRLGQTIRLR